MIRLNRLALAVASVLACGGSVAGQSISKIGKFETWLSGAHGPVTMSADGEWIAYTQNNGGGTCNPTFRFAKIRTDGSEYRIIIDLVQLWSILPGSTFPYRMSLTADGSMLYWWWPDDSLMTQCIGLAPLHTYRVDTESSVVEELFFNGQTVANLSHSDDGQVLVFMGWHPASGTYHWYKSGPDPSTAVEFLDPAPWSGTIGKVCGDGSKFVMTGHGGFPNYTADVYVYDFERSHLDIVSPYSVNDIVGLDISGDGSRIVYAGSSPLLGVVSDGTDFHEVSPYASGGSATITRDGNWVIHVYDEDGGSTVYKTHRTAWDGSTTQAIEGWTPSFLSLFHSPTNADGSVLPVLTDPPNGGALSVWFEHTPVLTTFGYGTPGTPIRWDIGGEPGGSFLLLYAFGPASIPVGSKGTLLLDPASLQVLISGTIGGPPYNIGTLSLTIPPGAVIPFPFDLHSQALVKNAAGTNGTLTNSTIFEISGSAAAMAAGSGDPGPALQADVEPARTAPVGAGPRSPGAPPFDPIERQRWLALMDPNYARLLADR